jgi:membrane fusion protein, multidrug efflux system
MNEQLLRTAERTDPKQDLLKEKERRPRRGRYWLVAIVLLLVVCAFYFWPKKGGQQAGNAQAGGMANARRGFAVPVVAAQAERGDIGVYLNGLGAVTPIYTVTVKTRVDGQLMDVRYREGQTVHRGEVLAQLDPRPYQVQLTQAQGQLAKDQALLDNARIDLTRYEGLVPHNAVPEQQVATQKALVAQYEGAVQSDQGQIDSAKLNITYCRIEAPITGRVGLRLVDPGNIVHASDANGLVVITQVDPISVIFTISEDQVPTVYKKLAAGQKLKVLAYDRDMTTKLAEGRLTTIDNQIDQTTGTVKLRADFDNKDNSLYPNQFVNVRLLVEEKHGITKVPTAVIQRNSDATYVYLVKPDSTVTVRQVKLGTSEGDQTEVTSGLNPGDEVVMTGVDKLQEGSKVKATLPDGEEQSSGSAQGQPGGHGGRGWSGGAAQGAGQGGAKGWNGAPQGSNQGGAKGWSGGGHAKEN